MQLHEAVPDPPFESDTVCEPLGVHVIPVGSVIVAATLLACEPDIDAVIVNVLPCVTLVGIVTLLIDIDPDAKTGKAMSIVIMTDIAIRFVFILAHLEQ